jgi:signal transduction histidine kinase
MIGGLWFQPPRRVLTGFLLVVVACVGALAWLGYRLLDQDRALEAQRVRDQLEIAADLTSAALDRKLGVLDKALGDPPDAARLPDGTILILAGAGNFEVYGSPRLLFYPEVVEAPPLMPDGRLRRAELTEFQKNDPTAAAALFGDAARSREPAVRAAALVGLGRTLRKAGRTREALDAYAELATLGSTLVSGLPAELLAREARLSALEASGRLDALRREAAAFLRDLDSGRWRLTRSAYEFRANEARRWIGGGPQPQPPSEALALSAVVEDLVEEWRGRPEPSSGQRAYTINSHAVLAAAIVAGPPYLTSLWREAFQDRRMRLALTGPEGQTILGRLPEPAERVAVRTAAVTRLPWTIHVSGADTLALASGVAARRRLLLAGLFILAVLLVVSSYSIVRAMTRELAVARLQSEFVASVSHEFRSPLTSMRQLSSMLIQGRLPSEDQRQRSYEFLADETGRLERLIEGLLDFGLMEAGEARYRLERCDARNLVGDTVAAFERTVSARGYRVELSLPDSACQVLADRDALGRATWNLLDNAVKYSPEHRIVWVDVTPRGDRLAIEVRDRGLGIPSAEQDAIFRKFVRGANSREAGIKGTGIGLAMVTHIVAAHGGEIRLESAPGEGSRFTILIPMEQGA